MLKHCIQRKIISIEHYVTCQSGDRINVCRSVPDRGTQSQLARSTRQPRFNTSVKICIAVYIVLVLFVLFLLVMCIWAGLQVLEICGFGSTLKSRQAKLSQAKPRSSVGSPPGRPQST
jgi:hypothetical protein